MTDRYESWFIALKNYKVISNKDTMNLSISKLLPLE